MPHSKSDMYTMCISSSTPVHYNYNALYRVVHEICSTAHSFDPRCESVTFNSLTTLGLRVDISGRPRVTVTTI